MSGKNVQRALKGMLFFRLIVLGMSIGLIFLYYYFFAEAKPLLGGIVLGVSGSATVWAAVEIVDFYQEKYQDYCDQRTTFLMEVQSYYSKMENVIKDGLSNGTIDWRAFYEMVKLLYYYVATYPFSGQIYTLSVEFEKLANYITRMYWKISACFYCKDGGLNKDDRAYEILEKTFIKNSTVRMSKTENINELEKIKNCSKLNNALIDEPLSYDALRGYEELIDVSDEGDLGEITSLTKPEKELITFVPSYHLRVDFLKKKDGALFPTITNIIFRKLQQF